MKPDKPVKIVIAAGGTGGHLFPGIAVAERFRRFHPEIELHFVGTKRGLESKVLPQLPWPLHLIKTPSFKDRRGLKKLSVFFQLPMAVVSTILLLLRLRPKLVFSVGGYASAPVVFSAFLLRIPVLLLEPNAIPGVTNRLLARFAKQIFAAFPEILAWFPAQKVKLTGNAVREHFFDVKPKKLDPEKIVVFCFGGSQGARALNRAMLEAAELFGSLKNKLHFIHQVGRQENLRMVEGTYQAAGISAEVYAFIDDMKTCYERSDVVIARSGATSIAELVAACKPSILVPYPFAADDHQRANAESVVKAGGALMFREEAFTADRLVAELKQLVSEPWRLEKMAASLKQMQKGDAAKAMMEECLRFIRKK